MPLEIQRGRSKWFYGRVEVNGRSVFKNLNVRIEGMPPVSLRDDGDAAFERSRAKAQAALDKFEADLRKNSRAEDLVQEILEIRTGSRMRSVLLADMADAWGRLPRKKRMSESHASQSASRIAKFVKFIATRFSNTREMAQVQETMAVEFMQSEEERGVSPKTYNDTLKLLRGCFERLSKQASIASNPFDEIPGKQTDTIHRKPFSIPEIEAILVASKDDPYINRLIVTGVCTAMRLGDCAKLKWETVNLAAGFIDVKTAKTGKLASIPIFGPLMDVLKAQPCAATGFVFPDLAKQHRVNSQLLTDRVRRVMTSVGFGDAIDECSETRGEFHQKRDQGLRRASIRDFQSFRVTWVTIALNAGIPIDLVRKVTGHQTVEVVLTSYHQPGREDFRRELTIGLPAVITGGKVAEALSNQAVRDKLLAMTDTTWRAFRDELLVGLVK